MDNEIRFFPEAGSTAAEHVDLLYMFLLAVSGFFTLLIFFLIFGFCLYYRRGRTVNRTIDPNARFWLLEIGWSIIPLGLSLVMFGWGANLYYYMVTPPDDCMVINVVGKQWMWKLQHPGGRKEINSLHLPVNARVRLRMISEDVIHSFYIPAFRLKQDVLPGRYTTAWFETTKVGEYHLFCAEYCGTSHAQMGGKVVVMSQADYAEWLRSGTQETASQSGEDLFTSLRCQSCHQGPTRRGPLLAGLYGRQRPLKSGETVIADDDYIRESILHPMKKVVVGFEPVMPTYRGQIGEEEILALLAYIKSLDGTEAPTDEQLEQSTTEVQ